MVTGRREDVATARREIISAAEHFSMIDQRNPDPFQFQPSTNVMFLKEFLRLVCFTLQGAEKDRPRIPQGQPLQGQRASPHPLS